MSYLFGGGGGGGGIVEGPPMRMAMMPPLGSFFGFEIFQLRSALAFRFFHCCFLGSPAGCRSLWMGRNFLMPQRFREDDHYPCLSV